MATATKQKKTFKETMQETGSKVKAYGQKKYEQAKTSAKIIRLTILSQL